MVVQHRFPLLLRKLDPETSISTPVPTRLFHRGSDYSHPRNLYSHARNPYSHPPGISIHIAPESVFTCPGIRIKTFNACFDAYSFENNALIGTTSSFPPSKWPSGNFFPATAAAIQFVNYNGGNYLLMSTSPYRNAGTDGKDLGADMSKIQSETATVY